MNSRAAEDGSEADPPPIGVSGWAVGISRNGVEAGPGWSVVRRARLEQSPEQLLNPLKELPNAGARYPGEGSGRSRERQMMILEITWGADRKLAEWARATSKRSPSSPPPSAEYLRAPKYQLPIQ